MPSALGKAEIVTFLTTLAGLQFSVSGAVIARCMAIPIAYFLPDRTLVFTDRSKLAQRLDANQTYLQICGVTAVAPCDLHVHDASAERAFVSLTWAYQNAEGDALRHARVQYVLCRARHDPETGADLRIEMVDYTSIAYAHFMRPPLYAGHA